MVPAGSSSGPGAAAFDVPYLVAGGTGTVPDRTHARMLHAELHDRRCTAVVRRRCASVGVS
ncbi:hypothetical protein CXR04_34205 [Streptomyces sp. CMB-StM0423]|nr:hypothetical protein CXR04_34205 [Streptomyces sp. CMB-StM0423]